MDMKRMLVGLQKGVCEKMAEHRQAVMEDYLQEFMAEWEGER